MNRTVGPVGSRDLAMMDLAIKAAWSARRMAPPNPWVGAVVVSQDGRHRAWGATSPPGGPHAEVAALASAGAMARGATCYVTLEPCCHQGRTPPCTRALIEAGVARVVVGVLDPDRRVAGRGVEELRASGVEVVTNVRTDVIEAQLAPYLKHRRTGLPYVVLKLASTLDGRTAAPDGTSQWITGPAARLDAHRLRADSGAIVVGRGTFEADRPRLNVRLPGPELPAVAPRRVVVTSRPLAADGWLVVGGSWQSILAELGRLDVLQVLVEGGATLSCGLHMSGLVDRYVVYQAPILMGGDDGLALLKGKGAPTLGEAFVGRLAEVRRVGRDLRIDLVA